MAIWHKNVKTMALLAAIKGFRMLCVPLELCRCQPRCSRSKAAEYYYVAEEKQGIYMTCSLYWFFLDWILYKKKKSTFYFQARKLLYFFFFLWWYCWLRWFICIDADSVMVNFLPGSHVFGVSLSRSPTQKTLCGLRVCWRRTFFPTNKSGQKP